MTKAVNQLVCQSAARNLHTRHSNARYAALDHCRGIKHSRVEDTRVHTKLESLGMFARDLLLEPYAML